MMVRLLLPVCLLLPALAAADQRYYVWTYQPVVEAEDELEMEYYLTQRVPERDDASLDRWEHQFEIEYGLGKGWDVGLYQVFEDRGGEFRYSKWKARTRWKLLDRPLGAVLYLEYQGNRDRDAADAAEMKLIFGRTHGGFDWALNYTAEYALSPSDAWEQALHAGASVPLGRRIRAGAEAFAIFEEEAEAFYAGPTVAFGGHDFWAAFNYAWGLNGDAEDNRARLIVGINLN
jgi:hypothetical protein